VVEAGSAATSKYGFKVGDYVCGCTRLGSLGYNSAQEYHLMDTQVTIPKPSNISVPQSATIGVGILTASLGLFNGLHLALPSGSGTVSGAKDEWVVVLGGASSVGKSAVQLARASGYSVIASCSPKSAGTLSNLGAASFDYKAPLEEQVKVVMDKTGGKVGHIFDAVATDDPVVAKALFRVSTAPAKYFATTNDWSGISDFEGGKTHGIGLGNIGRPDATELNAKLETYIPIIVKMFEAGLVRPSEYEEIGSGGFDDAIKAYKHQISGAGGSKKVVVKIQNE